MRLRISLLLFVVFVFSFCSYEKKEELVLPTSVTWSEHIAPIIFKTCTPCHRPGEAGTFNLLNYDDAVRNANKIRFTTLTKFMPPWPADPSYVHFADERVLSETEIGLIKKWVEDKMPRGDSTKEPVTPTFYAVSFYLNRFWKFNY